MAVVRFQAMQKSKCRSRKVDGGYSVSSTFLIFIFVLYLTHWMNQVAKNIAVEAAADM
jgi:hypothetical protein